MARRLPIPRCKLAILEAGVFKRAAWNADGVLTITSCGLTCPAASARRRVRSAPKFAGRRIPVPEALERIAFVSNRRAHRGFPLRCAPALGGFVDDRRVVVGDEGGRQRHRRACAPGRVVRRGRCGLERWRQGFGIRASAVEWPPTREDSPADPARKAGARTEDARFTAGVFIATLRLRCVRALRRVRRWAAHSCCRRRRTSADT
jgi:hypothetical protein